MARKRVNKKKMPCNKPRRSTRPGKKKMVKACSGGKERLIHYGDSKMKIKKNIPARRKSLRARHKCSTAKNKLTARYWSCKAW